MSTSSTIKSPKPRWFNGLLHSNTPSPDVDGGKPEAYTSFSASPPTGRLTSRPSAFGSNTSIGHFPSIPSHMFNQYYHTTSSLPPLHRPSDQEHTLSPFSEISMDLVSSAESDVQTIQFDDDIAFLQDVKLCDTAAFVPNIQYGKVVHVLSGSKLLVAARIYNGYTKVLCPKLYYFHIRLRDVSWSGNSEDPAKEELKRLVLDKIVLLTNVSMSTDGFMDAKVYVLHMNHLKHYLKYGSLHTIHFVHGDGNVYVNETINGYIRHILR
jgi:hypothetical protein